MFFSKSFGYALRSILYIATTSSERQRVQVEEIARQLAIPKYFLSKIMKKLVQNGLVNSTKGPYGGISINEKTLFTTLFELFIMTNGIPQIDNCVLRLSKCNSDHPCPLHHRMEVYKKDLYQLLTITTIGDLLNAEHPDYIKSISTI